MTGGGEGVGGWARVREGSVVPAGWIPALAVVPGLLVSRFGPAELGWAAALVRTLGVAVATWACRRTVPDWVVGVGFVAVLLGPLLVYALGATDPTALLRFLSVGKRYELLVYGRMGLEVAWWLGFAPRRERA